MASHLTARVAWHDDGWNGRICQKPDCNIYCVGPKSFPGDVIAKERNLTVERELAGKKISDVSPDQLPPCIYSANAFGEDSIVGYSNPPAFFYGGAARTEWPIPRSTVCVWPYTAMYGEDAYDETGRTDNDRRSQNAEAFFKEIEPGRSLIFYYANYSNPLSEEDSPRYALVGVSRVASVGERLSYQGASEKIRERYANGMIWARNVSSRYPEEGLRLPYHIYRDDPEALARFALTPENPQTCKYGALALDDDEAIGLLEQFLGAVRALRDMDDASEDWPQRETWLLQRIAELWEKRGLYPGLLNVMQHLKAETSIQAARPLLDTGRGKEVYDLFFGAIEGTRDAAILGLIGEPLKRLSRQWKLRSPSERTLLKDVLPRFNLVPEQIERIVSLDPTGRAAHSLSATAEAIAKNPYLICESYVGDAPDERIPWSTIDRGVHPSPELGGAPLAEIELDDARRFRALCVEQLRAEPNHTFRSADSILSEVNGRLKKLPETKQATFNARYFEVDSEILSEAIELREEDGRLWLYLKDVHEDERKVEAELRKLAKRPDISLPRPFDIADWKKEIAAPTSPLMGKAKKEYAAAVAAQAEACAAIFRRPLAVVTGGAGTGKTTVICAIIRAIRQTEGDGAIITVLAPTGKASDRVREKLQEADVRGVMTSTVHSHLAKNAWLNENLTIKRSRGKATGEGTLIVDEASMLDLGLMAALMRAIDWSRIRRLILVGDRNQLPPIGRGRVFADTIQWLDETLEGAGIARLGHNLRQMENKVDGRGTAILGVADLFVEKDPNDEDAATSIDEEALVAKIHKGGDVDADLKVVFWSDPVALSGLLVRTIESEMAAATKESLDPVIPYTLWRAAFDWKPERYQVLTPHRSDLHGVDALNEAIQARISDELIRKVGTLDGITLFDKVIQLRNRTKSSPIWAYNFDTKKSEQVEIFNGEIGFVQKHPFDKTMPRFLKRFQVRFARKTNLGVGYGRELSARGGSESVNDNLELAYAISVHKAQGSEFNNTYVIVPRSKARALSRELVYTALTRAKEHCTLLIEGDVGTLLAARRRENSQTGQINSSLFEEHFRSVPDELVRRSEWYEEGKIHEALGGQMVRSKSELIIANMLHERGVPFLYEKLCRVGDGTMYLPDFTISWRGETWFWEHWGRMDLPEYKKKRDEKVAWYNHNFSGRLLETFEGKTLSADAAALISKTFV